MDTLFTYVIIAHHISCTEVSSRGADIASLPNKRRGVNWLFKLGACITFTELKLNLKILHKNVANKGRAEI